MIKSESVERALHCWSPWINAVEDGQRLLSPDATAQACWDYAGDVLIALRLPRKAVLRIYFLSCVLSSYKRGKYFVLGDIRLPPPDKLRDSGSISRWWDFHPLPLPILTKNDVILLLDDCRLPAVMGKMSVSQFIRKFRAPHFMFLSHQHPVCQIGSKIKRGFDFAKAIECAKMKESMTYKEIGEKFGWAIQKDAYYRKGLYRCSTAYRYVRLGRMLISNSSEGLNRSFPEFFPDSAEQIAHSIEVTGLRAKIDNVFTAAINRVREERGSFIPAANEVENLTPERDGPLV